MPPKFRNYKNLNYKVEYKGHFAGVQPRVYSKPIYRLYFAMPIVGTAFYHWLLKSYDFYPKLDYFQNKVSIF